MITAKQAKDLSGPKAIDYLNFIGIKIKESASKGNHEVIIRQQPYCDWLYKENDLSGEPKIAIKELRTNGFEVKLFYQENQFVDIGLWIKW